MAIVKQPTNNIPYAADPYDDMISQSNKLVVWSLKEIKAIRDKNLPLTELVDDLAYILGFVGMEASLRVHIREARDRMTMLFELIKMVFASVRNERTKVETGFGDGADHKNIIKYRETLEAIRQLLKIPRENPEFSDENEKNTTQQIPTPGALNIGGMHNTHGPNEIHYGTKIFNQ